MSSKPDIKLLCFISSTDKGALNIKKMVEDYTEK